MRRKDPMKLCPMTCCHNRIERWRVFCAGHWFQIPAEMRGSIVAAKQAKNTISAAALTMDALKFLRGKRDERQGKGQEINHTQNHKKHAERPLVVG